MSEEIRLKTKEWERLLTYDQQQKYRNAIAQGWFSDYHGNGWRHETFYGAYIWKNPKYVKIVNIFRDIIGHKPTWDDITDDNLRDLYDEMQRVYAPNSVRTLCATIKAVIRENNPTRDIPSPTFGKILRAKTVPVQSVFLNDEEVRRIAAYHVRGRNQRYIQRMFVMECLCGARRSDCERISSANIDSSGRYLVYVAQKTKTEVKVPIHKRLRPFLVCGTGDEPPGGVSENTFNRNIQEMCRACGIDNNVKIFHGGKYLTGPKWKFVTTHTGRRSFATNLSQKGVPLEQIALMMGHMSGNTPNISMTLRYIVGKPEIDSSTLRIFGVYDEDYPVVKEDDEIIAEDVTDTTPAEETETEFETLTEPTTDDMLKLHVKDEQQMLADACVEKYQKILANIVKKAFDGEIDDYDVLRKTLWHFDHAFNEELMQYSGEYYELTKPLLESISNCHVDVPYEQFTAHWYHIYHNHWEDSQGRPVDENGNLLSDDGKHRVFEVVKCNNQ